MKLTNLPIILTASVLAFCVFLGEFPAVLSEALNNNNNINANIIPRLPFGDINVLVVTDVHSFIGGHRHESGRNADYGDVLSFYQRVKAFCDEQKSDFWFVNNGDWLHGTGLAIDGNASQLIPLLNKMPWDIINLGNHESYQNAVVEATRDVMIPHFGKDRFLTSNTLWSETMEPFGSRYKILQGNNNTIIVFGFMYNLHNPSELLTVAHVEDVVKEDWFKQALTEETYDAILVLAHMGNDDPLVQTIHAYIRSYVGETMPVQFVTGHTHKREQALVAKDPWSHAMEAGGFMDTIGFVSFPTHETAKLTDKGHAKDFFRFQFLNASKPVLTSTLGEGVDSLLTEDGAALSKQIKETQKNLGLNAVVGCPPRNYYRDRNMFESDSIWKLWKDHVIPTQICKLKSHCVFLTSSNIWRYDILTNGKQDAMTVDDVVTISPLMQPVVYVGEVQDWAIRRMNSSLNTYSLMRHDKVPDYVLAGDIEEVGSYSLYTHEFNLPEITYDLNRLNVKDLKLRRTGDRDTLYWLSYIEDAWLCPGQGPKNVRPWFKNIDELEEEKGDGSENYFDQEMDGSLDEDLGNDHVDEPKEDLHYQGYHGYIPPSTIDKYKDVLPSEVNAGVALKPDEHRATDAPKKETTKPAKHTAAANKVKNKAKRKKIRRTILKVFALVIAGGLLLFPLTGLYRSIRGGNEKDEDNDMMNFYDPEEVQALKREKKKKNKNTRKPITKNKKKSRRFMPSEIEIT